MRLLFLFFSLALGLLMPSKGFSSEDNLKPIQTVGWYKMHKEERLKVVAICNDNPGELKNSPNCVNAIRAHAIEQTGRVSDLKQPDLSKIGFH